MARKIIGSVWDREARNAINDNFEELYGYKNTADSAKEAADYAVNTAEFAKAKAESVQAQFNQVVIEGDSSVEAAQARVGADGTVYNTLKERLDAEYVDTNERLDAEYAELNERLDDARKENAYFHEYTVTQHFDEVSNTTYYLTLIRHKDEDGNIIKLKRGFMEGESGETVRSFANRVGATVAINASAFLPYDFVGTDIYNGVIQKEAVFEPHMWILGIKEDNTLVYYPPGTPAQSIINDGCLNALTAFTPVIVDGEPFDDVSLEYDPNHFNNKHPRQIIAQYDNKDLLILTCGGRGIEGEGMTYSDLVRILMGEGVNFAFMLDGGGSTQTVVRGRAINRPIDGNGYNERKVVDFLYVGKEIPTNRDRDIVDANSTVGVLGKGHSDLTRTLELMGDISSNTTKVDDLNTVNKSGLYWSNAGLTVNSPDSSISWGVIHFKIDNSAFQIAFPFSSNTNYKPKQRRMNPNPSDGWAEWRDF